MSSVLPLKFLMEPNLMPETFPIWPAKLDADPADVPTLSIYPAAHSAGGSLVLVLPGGGYAALANHEGETVAQWLNTHGFHAAVLRYRLGPRHRHPAMVQDAQRAMRLLRKRASEWDVNPRRIAVLGFSAGGHLASSLATHHQRFVSPEDDLAATHDARPDAAVLCYPVIDMGEFAHVMSRNRLLGPDPDPALLALLSNHLQVAANTPPTFLWHTADDAGVPVEGSLFYAAACRKHKVPVELHVFESGKHGLGLADGEPAGRMEGPLRGFSAPALGVGLDEGLWSAPSPSGRGWPPVLRAG